MTVDEIRLYILNVSLEMEHMTGLGLSYLLGIQNPEESYTLGNKSSALSFKTKIEMLIDIGAAEGNTKGKFLKFMEIRNQFMHNINATNFSSCIDYVEGAEGFLVKNYSPDPKLDKEAKMEFCIKALCADVLQMKDSIIQNSKAVMLQKHQNELQASAYTIVSNLFRNPEPVIIKAMVGKIPVDGKFTTKQMIEVLNTVLKAMTNEARAEWKKIVEKHTI